MTWITITLAVGVSVLTIVVFQWLGTISSRYLLKDFDKEKILLQVRKGPTKQISWDIVRAILPSGFCQYDMHLYHNFTLELENGQYVDLVIAGGDVPRVLEGLYDIFRENLDARGTRVEHTDFAHSDKWVISKRKLFRLHCTLIGFGILAVIFVGLSFEGLGTYLFPVPFIIIFAVIVLQERQKNRGRKCVVSLKVAANKLVWKDEFGQLHTHLISEVSDYHLHKTRGALTFSDSTEVKDLEKMRYWPLLREHLLSTLEPSNENRKAH